jgi:hypothetical protein
MSRVSGLYQRVSSLSPVLFLAAYVLLIPLFAGLYWGLGQLPTQQFYAPYAKFEPTALADVSAVEASLRQAMVRSFRSHVTPTSDWALSAEDIHASHLSIEGEIATFTVSLVATRYENGEIRTRVGGPQATVRIDKQRLIEGAGDQRLVCHLVAVPSVSPEMAPFTFDLRALFRAPDAAILADTVCWSAAQEYRFERLVAGSGGDPSLLSGFFGRMVYFSATTLTTTGFGDIVPLSPAARWATGLEAVSGGLLAGLFLNAIAWRAGRSAPPPPPAG